MRQNFRVIGPYVAINKFTNLSIPYRAINYARDLHYLTRLTINKRDGDMTIVPAITLQKLRRLKIIPYGLLISHIHAKHMTNLTTLSCYCTINIDIISHLTNITSLMICGSKISNFSLLGLLHNLKILRLSDSDVGDGCLNHISHIGITELDIDGCKIGCDSQTIDTTVTHLSCHDNRELLPSLYRNPTISYITISNNNRLMNCPELVLYLSNRYYSFTMNL